MNFQSIRRCSSIGDRITSVLSAIVAAFENSHTVKEDARAMKESKRRKKNSINKFDSCSNWNWRATLFPTHANLLLRRCREKATIWSWFVCWWRRKIPMQHFQQKCEDQIVFLVRASITRFLMALWITQMSINRHDDDERCVADADDGARTKCIVAASTESHSLIKRSDNKIWQKVPNHLFNVLRRSHSAEIDQYHTQTHTHTRAYIFILHIILCFLQMGMGHSRHST